MPEAYKALRVPIALLQQKVYPTSQRLDFWEGHLDEAKKEEVKSVSIILPAGFSSYSHPTTVAGNVIVPTRASFYQTKGDNLFDTVSYLRRFFVYLQGGNSVSCRYCNKEADDAVKRGAHQSCMRIISEALRKLVINNVCLVCEEALKEGRDKSEYNGLPVCSDKCLKVWDWTCPELFDEAVILER